MPRAFTHKAAILLFCLCLCAQPALVKQSPPRPANELLRTLILRMGQNNDRALPPFWDREFKSDSSYHAGKFLGSVFKDVGLKPAVGKEDYLQQLDGGGRNVVGMITGADPMRKDEFVLISAHYDA